MTLLITFIAAFMSLVLRWNSPKRNQTLRRFFCTYAGATHIVVINYLVTLTACIVIIRKAKSIQA